jgi:hypothetical protein
MTSFLSARPLSAAILLAAGLAIPLRLPAQAPERPSPQTAEGRPTDNDLDGILAALEANVADYSHSVPSFLCKEHVVSEMEPMPNPTGFVDTTTESIFRIFRAPGADGQSHLHESRVLQTVDGKPPRKDSDDETSALEGPMSVVGIFSGGLNLVSASGKACFRYKLHPARRGRPADRDVIEFEDLPPQQRDPSCPYTDKISGRAFVELESMRVVRMETKMRDHPTPLGFTETWDWAIDYAAVTLGGKTFWMPATIHSRAVPNPSAAADATSSSGGGRRGGGASGSSRGSPLTYTLDAKYTDYHRMNVVSRIVPASVADEKPVPEPAPTPTPAH